MIKYRLVIEMVAKYQESVEDLLCRIDSLEEMYNSAWQQNQEIKFLQGLERCIELRMKLFGYDGKNQVAITSSSKNESKLDLGALSEATLREIEEQLKI